MSAAAPATAPASSSERRHAGRGRGGVSSSSCSGASACATTAGHANGAAHGGHGREAPPPAAGYRLWRPRGRTMAATSISEQELHVVSPRQTVRAHLRDVWRFRELLRNLIRKELKVKYKNSVLGFVWSMVNPLF